MTVKIKNIYQTGTPKTTVISLWSFWYCDREPFQSLSCLFGCFFVMTVSEFTTLTRPVSHQWGITISCAFLQFQSPQFRIPLNWGRSWVLWWPSPKFTKCFPKPDCPQRQGLLSECGLRVSKVSQIQMFNWFLDLSFPKLKFMPVRFFMRFCYFLGVRYPFVHQWYWCFFSGRFSSFYQSTAAATVYSEKSSLSEILTTETGLRPIFSFIPTEKCPKARFIIWIPAIQFHQQHTWEGGKKVEGVFGMTNLVKKTDQFCNCPILPNLQFYSFTILQFIVVTHNFKDFVFSPCFFNGLYQFLKDLCDFYDHKNYWALPRKKVPFSPWIWSDQIFITIYNIILLFSVVVTT